MAYKNFRKTEIIDELCAELRKVRNQKELTLAQVAAGLGELGTQISSIMLGRIETGQRRIDDDLFLALCAYYDTDPDKMTIKACRAHIASLQEQNSMSDGSDDDALRIIETYHELSAERQADIRTMLRMYAYMNKFEKR